MKPAAKLFKALSDPNRLRIVNILCQGSACVRDLANVLGLPQPLVSRHLAYLRNAGLVEDRRESPRVCYSIALEDPLGQAVRSFLGEVLLPFEESCEDIEKLAEYRKAGLLASCPTVPERDCGSTSLNGCGCTHTGSYRQKSSAGGRITEKGDLRQRRPKEIPDPGGIPPRWRRSATPSVSNRQTRLIVICSRAILSPPFLSSNEGVVAEACLPLKCAQGP